MSLDERASTWRLRYEEFDPQEEGLREALCALGNGYFVTRAAAPEASADEVHYPGTYLAGGYNRLVTPVGGRPVENEDLVNVPNWLPLTFRIGDGDWFHLSKVNTERYELDLDMRQGLLARVIEFSDAAGRRTELRQRLLVHMGDKNVAALETTVTPLDWSGPLTVRAALDGRVTNWGVPRYRELDGRHLRPLETGQPAADSIDLVAETTQSRIRIAEAARVRLVSEGRECEFRAELEEEPGYVALRVPCEVREGVPLTVEKVVVLYSSRERAISEPRYAARTALEHAPHFDELLATHRTAWDGLWERCSVAVNDGDETERILRLHVFQTLQTVSPNSIGLDAGVGARGLHGEAYRGHVFWDEAYIFPLLNRTLPAVTRDLLMYRYRRLPAARRLARAAGFQGALFPWQSGSDGREETQVVHLNPQSGRWLPDVSHLQRHVNAAIAYNIWQYWETTGDLEFLSSYGAEMLLEIARFFTSLTTRDKATDRYQILGVMGPDEYHTGYPWREEPGLDNNAYTNVMAAWVLWRALDALETLPRLRREGLIAALRLSQEEFDRWDDISRRMKVVFHEGVISQFEHYGKLEEFDWDGYRERHGNIQRLDRILEKEGDSPNRYRLAKQADTLMLFYFFSGDELKRLFTRLGYELPEETVVETIRHYTERTSHGSTLSAIVHAWVLRQVECEDSWRFFRQALRSDLYDTQGGTTREGIHLGTMAGTVDLLERGYLGLEIRDEAVCFAPCLPAEIEALRYPLLARGRWLDVEVEGERLRVSHRPYAADTVAVRCGGTTHVLKPGETAEFILDRGLASASRPTDG